MKTKNFEKQIPYLLFTIFAIFLYAALVVYAHDNIPLIVRQFLLPSIIIFVFVYTFTLWARDEFLLFSIILISLGFLYFLIGPIKMIPDEHNHFFRAFEISLGKLISKKLSDGHNSGNILPQALADFYYSADNSIRLDWNNLKELSFSNTALYSPFSYIPQSLGIFIVRHFTNRVSMLYYAARLFNFLSSVLLSIFALKKIPFGKKILFIIMLMPMTMQEMISLSPDGLVNSLCFAFIAFVLHCTYSKEDVTKKDIAVIGAMIVIISLCKIVYVVFFFLIYLIPNTKIKDKKHIYVLKVIFPLIAIIVNFIWLSIAAHFLVSFSHNGSNPTAQVLFVVLHPVHYVVTIMRTFFERFQFYLLSCIGAFLGRLEINTNPLCWLGMLILVVFETARNDDIAVAIRKRDCIILLLVFFLCSLLILTSLYVQWTTAYAKSIDGVQGRYFIPLLPTFLLPVTYQNYCVRMKIKNIYPSIKKISYIPIFILFFNFIAIIDVCKFYPDISKSGKVTAVLAEDFSSILLIFDRMKNYDEIQVAIWSEPDDQDDLHWFHIPEKGKNQIEYTIPLELYDTNGKYLIHVYGVKNNEMIFVTQTDLNINFSEKHTVMEEIK